MGQALFLDEHFNKRQAQAVANGIAQAFKE